MEFFTKQNGVYGIFLGLSAEFGLFSRLLHDGYGADIAYPFGMYFFSRVMKRTPSASAICPLLACNTFELAQGLNLCQGTFDPKDFLAYTLGSLLALTIDHQFTKKSAPLETIVQESQS